MEVLRALRSWRGLSCATCWFEPQMVTTVGDSTLVDAWFGSTFGVHLRHDKDELDAPTFKYTEGHAPFY